MGGWGGTGPGVSDWEGDTVGGFRGVYSDSRGVLTL